MAIAASGAVSMSDLRTEFVGGSAAISFSDLYRGGSNIRAKQSNNTSTNLAASVPTSGAIDFQDFYGTAKGFRKTYTAGATNQNAADLFGNDWGVNYPKEIVINSGVELGATTTSEEALEISSGLSGGLTVTNNGTLSGAGGSAGGGAGGDAFEANSACILINNGTIRAGGGGGGNGGNGGNGGAGGQGRTSFTNYSGQITSNRNFSGTTWLEVSGNAAFYFVGWANYNGRQNGRVRWYAGTGSRGNNFQGMTSASSYTVNGTMGSVSAQALDGDFNSSSGSITFYYKTISTGYNYHSGGSGGSGGGGGSGGRGQGYNHGNQNGSGGSGGANGSGGGTNAGNGGRGGNGGNGGNGGGYGAAGGNGASGATGNSGGNGNHTNGSGGSGGSSGSGGGAAGKYIRGLSNVTFTNNGTVQGGTA